MSAGGRRIDRRALFASGAAAALLAAAGLAPETRPRRGGQLRVALAREDGGLDLLARGAAFQTLTEIAPDGLLRGDLAQGWTGDRAARRWSFALLPRARFHDGRAVTATDAAASLAPFAERTGARVFAAGEGDIVIELREGDPDLPLRLSDSRLVVAPDGDASAGIGSGAYAVRRWHAGRDFLGERFAAYSGEGGWADRVEAVVIPDPRVRAEALRDGYVDIAERPCPDGLCGGGFRQHPAGGDAVLAAHPRVGIPSRVSTRGALDDGRLARRWWLA